MGPTMPTALNAYGPLLLLAANSRGLIHAANFAVIDIHFSLYLVHKTLYFHFIILRYFVNVDMQVFMRVITK